MKPVKMTQCAALAVMICFCWLSSGFAAESDLLAPIAAVGDYVNDAGTTAEVKTRLAAEQGLGGADISVTTTDSVVRLDGVVTSEAQAQLAEHIAATPSNVREVVNNLKIGR